MVKEHVFWKPVVIAIKLIVMWVLQVNGTTCDYIDSCTCEMSDGSGKVNLRSLGVDSGFFNYDYAFHVVDTGWDFLYNPCYDFSFSSYSNLAIAQSDMNGFYGYDLGIQSSAYFNLTESSGLSIHYTAGDALRTSRVLLICEPGTYTHNFQFVGELIITEYDFILTTPCSCPGACDDDGILATPPTPTTKQPGSSNQVNIPNNIQVNVHHAGGSSSFNLWTDVGGTTTALILHDLLLILVIAAVVIIIRNTSWCNCFQSDNSSTTVSNKNFVNLSDTNSLNRNV